MQSNETAVTVTVAAVGDAGGEGGEGGAPIALVHASELQSISGAADGQLADRVLVWGNSDTAQSAATDAYPDASVEIAGRTDPTALFEDGLAFATSVIALIVGVTICASFVATTMGMTVDEDRRTLAVLESIGVPTRGRLAVVAISTGITTFVGSLVGIALGAGDHGRQRDRQRDHRAGGSRTVSSVVRPVRDRRCPSVGPRRRPLSPRGGRANVRPLGGGPMSVGGAIVRTRAVIGLALASFGARPVEPSSPCSRSPWPSSR